ncbi:MAG: hypothetical protein P1P76_05285 [Anaerolineales bacterium]|nr:hypothetical protein [Anaerolineales bacterium]
MPYEIAVDQELELIEIHVMGETNPLEALEARNRAALISAERGYRKVVVYGSRLEKIQGFSPAMIFNFASSFRQKPFPLGTKFAIIPARVSGSVNTLARIAREHGTRMHIFEDGGLAIDWLSGSLATAELEVI